MTERDEIPIELNCHDASRALKQARSQRSLTRPNLDYGFVGAWVDGVNDATDDAAIDEKVLT